MGNVGTLFGGIELFEDSRDHDGLLELGVLTATGAMQTARTAARIVVGTVDDAPHATTTKASDIRVTMDRKVLYQVDGGDREKVRSLRFTVEPGGVVVCVPGRGEAEASPPGR